MGSAATRSVGKAVAERVSGAGPGRLRALSAAVVAGVTVAVLTYRLLRSGQ
jgi:hypothetical protein